MTTKAMLGNAGKYVNGTFAAPAVTAQVPPVQAYTQVQAKRASNGISSPKRTQNGSVDAERVRESIVAALEAQAKPVGTRERSEFVREVLALIRTDKAFVDTLWQQYTARLA